MPYVQRDAQGQIKSVSAEAGGEHEQWIDSDAPELRTFLAQLKGDLPEALESLIDTDQSLIRVLEDVIDTLVAKNLIYFTDLPEAAQKKLLKRRSLRSSVNALKLFKDDDQGLI